MRVLFLADPVERLKPKTDTSFSILRELMSRSYECCWAMEKEIFWREKDVFLRAHPVAAAGNSSTLPSLDPAHEVSIREFDVILIRKEPPFDQSYLNLCWFLAPYEKQILMINRPTVLLQHHEKMIPFDAVSKSIVKKDEIIDSVVSTDLEVVIQFVKNLKSEKIIIKPWLGHGGRDVSLLSRADFLKDPKIFKKFKEDMIVQPFEENIYQTGDRRILYFEGKILGHFVRIPKKGSHVANLAQGGSAELRPFTPKEEKLAMRLGEYFVSEGLDFVGVDFINEKLSEVNVTSPTGIYSYLELAGKNIAPALVDGLLRRFEEGTQL